MGNPAITILMPVYNGEKYLREAVESILLQSCRDFEFLIIDDGSTDTTAEIIRSFSDSRIRFVQNASNLGLIASLNKGIDLAKGTFIARMDCDDISYPERLQEQLHYLQENKHVSMVAAWVRLVRMDGKSLGEWKDDKEACSETEILRMLPRTNCIAHPSVMMRSDIARRYRYKSNQQGSEDWDLWMRMAADGKTISKINKVLLDYRVHPLSETSVRNRRGVHDKITRVQRNYLINRLLSFRVSTFDFRVLYCFIKNNIGSFLLFFSKIARYLKINPLHTAMDYYKLKHRIKKCRNSSGIFFFFPYNHIGGAEKVHAAIVQAVSDKKPWVFFTGFSRDHDFRGLFSGNAEIFVIPRLTHYPFFKTKTIRLVSQMINGHDNPTVFGSNSSFFYEIINSLQPSVLCMDLLHAFVHRNEIGAEHTSLPYINRLNRRIIISENTRDELREQYAENNVDAKLLERIVCTPNATTIPESWVLKGREGKIRVLYAGRDSPEKRIRLIGKVAGRCMDSRIPAEFTLAGDMKNLHHDPCFRNCRFAGQVPGDALYGLYNKSDVLILTSSREGFPMVIMEAMACGLVPLTTRVGGISYHVHHKKNGIVIESDREEEIVSGMVSAIQELAADRELLNLLSHNAHDYARENFNMEKFITSYRKLLLHE